MLPKIAIQTYKMKLPSTKKEIEYRPYTVKEQNILLMANESEDIQDLIDATKKICESCILTDIKVEDLTSFDLQQLFINIRAKSVGETIEMKFRCNNDVVVGEDTGIETKGKCNTINTYKVDLSKVSVVFPPGHTNEIMVTDSVGIKMKYPSLASSSVFKKLYEAKNKTQIDLLIELLQSDLDYIYDAEKIYDEYSESELKDFIETLSLGSLEKIIEFYSSIPYVSYTINYKCSKCEFEETIELKGLQDFFEQWLVTKRCPTTM